MAQKIIDKVRALLRKAESAREIGSQSEAETFAKKAQELILKYNLEKHQLGEGKDPQRFEALRWDYVPYYKKTEANWIAVLFSCIAEFNFCRVVINSSYHKGKKQPIAITVLGERENAETVVFICEQLINRIRSMKSTYWKEYQAIGGYEKKNTWSRGFFRGVVAGLYDQLQKQREEQKKKNEQVGGLMLYNDKALEEFTTQQYPRLRTSRSSRLTGISGFQQGVSKGRSMTINKGIQ